MLRNLLACLTFIVLGCTSLNAQINVVLSDSLTYSSNCNDIWGYTDSLGNEFALVGRTNGVSIVDVTDPTDIKELHWISSTFVSTWRDLKVWKKYAYVTNETGGGLQIIDLSNILDTTTAPLTYSTSLGGRMTSAHDIYIDENGLGYVVGADYLAGGAIVIDCDSIPTNPPVVGLYNDNYIHDCFVRGDTLWSAEINAGQFSVVDMSDPWVPVVLATQITETNFCHAIWVNDENTHCFTVDERSGAPIESWDVSDLSNIKLEDQIRSNPGSGVIPHNLYYRNGWLVTSYYRDGMVVHDAHEPDILVEVGNFDTSPLLAGSGFNGNWGVYPFFSSGTIICSDIERGLYVLTPTYQRACYLKGNVCDTLTTLPIDSVLVEIVGTGESTYTDVLGNYKMGIADTGTFTIRFSKTGYDTKTIAGVSFSRGVITILDAKLYPQVPFNFSGKVCDSTSGAPLVGAQVLVTDGAIRKFATTNASGIFTIDSLFKGTYDIYAANWGHKTNVSTAHYLTSLDSTWSDSLCLATGYYDDFILDLGWTTSATATTGLWTREEPIGTTSGGDESNPDLDVTTDFLDLCYTTGNGGGGAGTDDIDNGRVYLVSPSFDLSTYTEPLISYYRWFFNAGGSGTPNDSLKVILDNGSTTVEVDLVWNGSEPESQWIFNEFLVSDFITPSSTMTITFESMDDLPGHLVEAAIDKFSVRDSLPPVPMANFNVSETEGCAPLSVSFTDVSTNSPTTWAWTFPGGTPSSSTMANPTVSFSAGSHLVKLIVSNAFGSDSMTQTIVVFENPMISVSTTSSSGSDGTASASSTMGTAPYSYSWSTGSTADSIGGLAPGNYSVVVTDSNGCMDSSSFYVPDLNSGIANLENSKFRIFPNPASDVLQIELDEVFGTDVIVAIYSINGVLQNHYTIPAGTKYHSVDLELSSGCYLVQSNDLGAPQILVIK